MRKGILFVIVFAGLGLTFSEATEINQCIDQTETASTVGYSDVQYPAVFADPSDNTPSVPETTATTNG